MNIVDPVHFHAATRPAEPAIILPQRRISWHQLDQSLRAAALQFHHHGLVAGNRVGLTIQNPVLHLVAALALARIGVAHVALSLLDPPSLRQSIRDKLQLNAVIVDSDKFSLPEAAVIPFKRLSVLPNGTKIPDELICNSDTATWLFLQSSGTTGAPKFSALTHAAAMARSKRYLPLFNCGVKDVFWPISRVDFVVAKQRAIYALQAGAAICLPVGIPISPEILIFLRAAGVTLACGTPSHLHQLIALSEKADAIPTLRAFEVRSATVSERLRKAFKQRFSPNLHIVYGTNEGEALAIAPPELQAKVPNTVGRATASIELQVVDNDGKPVNPDIIGEVRVRGPGVIKEYFQNIEATNKSFRDGWFYPGDLASLTADQALILQGRKDDMMIFDGMNIYPAEIETVLLDHPCVKEAAAYSVKHNQYQDIPLAAVIVDSPVTEEELIRYCIERIGSKCPKKIRFVDDFPRNAMGKILKRELAAHEPKPHST